MTPIYMESGDETNKNNPEQFHFEKQISESIEIFTFDRIKSE